MINHINSNLIKELRRRTSVSISKCKQALIESSGNIELAIDNIRKSGLKTDINKFGQCTPAGLVVVEITSDKKKGIIIEINCETDFVAKNNVFQDFAKIVIMTALRESINEIDVLKTRFEKECVLLMNQVGENIKIHRFSILTGDFLSSYIHGTKIGVLISASGSINENIIKNVAMHIAASNPKYMYITDIPKDILMREHQIYMDMARQSGKSLKILEKIVEGQMNKFIKAVVLMNQDFILDTNQTVGNVLNIHNIKINNFIRFEIGNNN